MNEGKCVDQANVKCIAGLIQTGLESRDGGVHALHDGNAIADDLAAFFSVLRDMNINGG